ncbi:hypothetical protein [Agarilytica rhodophyticola]|uniref:hypothetical protein n=1 Tax=Agarilytica rhodophyticola TaxID=1737490 RepID=UPI00131A1075|nr:hypothetical protein [Agarilytica rhodophyticola]
MELTRDQPFLAIVGDDTLLRPFDVTNVQRAQSNDKNYSMLEVLSLFTSTTRKNM